LTPEYASPEQVKGEAVNVSSDVYSLGVVLYELLTGHRPYQFKSRRADEIAKIICELQPEKPSTAINRAAGTNETGEKDETKLISERISQMREGSPEKLRRRLRGNLDNIVLTAMRKEPSRRYASVEQFSEDIRRHLVGLPVTARKDTWNYRAVKFVRRNSLAVGFTALIVLALLCGIAATAWQARRAERERALAERRFENLRKMSNSISSEIHNAIRDLPGSLPARQLLITRAVEQLDALAEESGDNPALQADLAAAYQNLGVLPDKTLA
jgi:eukaryotic-like serine/threonine-protein kinase